MDRCTRHGKEAASSYDFFYRDVSLLTGTHPGSDPGFKVAREGGCQGDGIYALVRQFP